LLAENIKSASREYVMFKFNWGNFAISFFGWVELTQWKITLKPREGYTMKINLVNCRKLMNVVVLLSLLTSALMPVQAVQASKAWANEPVVTIPDTDIDLSPALKPASNVSSAESPLEFSRPSFPRPEPVKANLVQSTVVEPSTTEPSVPPSENATTEKAAPGDSEPTVTPIVPTPITISPTSVVNSSRSVKQEAISSSQMIFIQNVGQFDKRARFVVRGANGAIQVADDAIWMTYLEPEKKEKTNNQLESGLSPTPGPDDKAKGGTQGVRNGENLRFHFVGGNSQTEIEGFNPQPSTISYLLGDDPSQWFANVPSYTGIIIRTCIQVLTLR
jgi:hypothetical protein